MTASVGFLFYLIGGATLLVTLAPLVLLAFWVWDLRKGNLW